MHKLFKDRLYVIENGPGGVRWYTNGHFALSANVVVKARYTKGLKFLQELPALRAGVYRDGDFKDGENTPNVEQVIPSGKLAKVTATDCTIETDRVKVRVFAVGDDTVSLIDPDYAALLDVAPFLSAADDVSPLCGRLTEDGPIEILVMPMYNRVDGRVYVEAIDDNTFKITLNAA